MIKWALHKAINRFEREWNYDAGYMHDMIEASPRAAWLFSRVVALGQFRRDLPIEAWCAAGLTAVRHEDCGPCVQIVVNLAKKDGVAPEVLQSALAAGPDALPQDLADAYRFAEAVVTRSGDEDLFRERIRQRHGEAGLVEMALAVAVCRIFPTVKRGLGYATSCSKVTVQV